jgi:hypothetical protein
MLDYVSFGHQLCYTRDSGAAGRLLKSSRVTGTWDTRFETGFYDLIEDYAAVINTWRTTGARKAERFVRSSKVAGAAAD